MSPAPRSLGDIAARFTRPVRTVAPRPTPAPAEILQTLREARVEFGGATAAQADETSCGAAALVMLNATGDGVLAQWLETGELPDLPAGELPPEIPAAATRARLGAAERFRAAQEAVRSAATARTIGPLAWPRSLGTPPWGAARAARFPGVRYASRPVDDRGAAGQEMLALILNALGRGYPVLLYTGGNRGTGLTTALPRHVVLAVPGEGRVTPQGEPVISIYEPHSGHIFELPASDLVDRTERSRALGGWTHVQWLVLPRPA